MEAYLGVVKDASSENFWEVSLDDVVGFGDIVGKVEQNKRAD